MSAGRDGVSAPERLEIIVTGRVQGVGFRWHAAEEAARLGVTGWARNRADGSVQIVAEGPREALAALADWAALGPARARVERCETAWGPASGGFTAFGITG